VSRSASRVPTNCYNPLGEPYRIPSPHRLFALARRRRERVRVRVCGSGAYPFFPLSSEYVAPGVAVFEVGRPESAQPAAETRPYMSRAPE
jgi:hypothetical protein